MSSYAKVVDGLIDNVIVCEDSEISALDGLYVKVLESRGKAVIGGSYDSDNDRFIDIKPWQSWVLNENFEWESPLGENPDILTKKWDEDTQSWVDRS